MRWWLWRRYGKVVKTMATNKKDKPEITNNEIIAAIENEENFDIER